ncbi:hypothetical protein [Paenibacillus protaetiae]|uniref:ApeA N-terminal domain-containing protein n=1 Tax=Paenibacillus protaetiae TaxID=2509456 RepID=A0A4P6EZR2_9BACL|nr:hypothetical protein [Paenibacillus protaetiae]QAY67309.1 hypothetical protein ET464_13770 [Paenibacillus protaetiae]
MSLEQKDPIFQIEQINHLINVLGTEQWVTVYKNSYNDSNKITYWSALIPKNKVNDVLNNDSWDLLIGRGMPGCSEQYNGNSTIVKYLRFGNESGIEPLVYVRDFHGRKPSYVEVSEEFRLFHNFYYDSKTSNYLHFDDNGDEDTAIIASDNEVRIKLKYIKQFLAIKDLRLALYVEADVYSKKTLAELSIGKKISQEYKSGDIRYHFHINECFWMSDKSLKTFSRIIGKKLIAGMSKESSGIWPYEAKRQYQNFIIEIDENGTDVSYNCNPDYLANYFGGNPDAPHYLTPVFFRREVLNKYYSQPENYTVKDGSIECNGFWSLRIDNNHPSFVIVYLGDLGRDLPDKEQTYWKSFNIPPDGQMSSVKFKRDFLAEWTSPESSDLIFKLTFETFQKLWLEHYRWNFFKPLESKDEHHYKSLRIPLTNDQSEFDQQVLSLVKIIIDSLNEKEIERLIVVDDPKIKGLSKLELLMKQRNIAGFEVHIKFLRNLYELRSSGVGHRKGKNYEKICKVFAIGEKDLRGVFNEILNSAVQLILFLQTCVSRGEIE